MIFPWDKHGRSSKFIPGRIGEYGLDTGEQRSWKDNRQARNFIDQCGRARRLCELPISRSLDKMLLLMTTLKAQRKAIPGALLAALLLLAVSAFINYVDRGNLSVAAPLLKDELGISAAQLGILLSAFFWTYACLQPVSGWLVDRWNVNWVFAAGFFLWSAATAATGMVHTFAALMLLRLVLGIGESVAYPSYCKILAINFSEEHRGFA